MLRPIFLLLVLSALNACAVNPVTGKNELAFVSESTELAIGKQQYLPSQQSQGGLYNVDPELSRYVNEVGQRLAAVSDRQLPYEFVVLNNSVPNAWALPGGKIAVNRGLLLHLKNEAELAAVLGHEIVHAAARHGAKSIERESLLQGAIMVTEIGTSGTEYSNFIVGKARLGAQLLTHKYGRGAELESDYYGIQYMVKAGYDPRATITLQQTFVQLSAGRESSFVEGLFASHPPSQERVDKNRATVASLSYRLRPDLEVGEQRYRDKLAYLINKQDAYNSFDQANALRSSNELVIATRLLDEAIQNEPMEPRFYGLRGNILYDEEHYREAAKAFNKALDLDDNYYEYYLGRGLATLNLGQNDAARIDLSRSNELLPTAIAMNKLGQIALVAGHTSDAKAFFESAMSAGGEVGSMATVEFKRLDLQENPGKYLTVRPHMREGKLMAAINNRASIDVNQFEVVFTMTLNGKFKQLSAKGGAIRAGQTQNVSSGLRLREEDELLDLRSYISSAKPFNPG
jgi:predicted Zn-dependent protease